MEYKKNIYGHLSDLRRLLIRVFIVFFVAFCILFSFSDNIFQNLLNVLKIDGIKLVFNSVEGAFLSKMSVSFNAALIILIPYFGVEAMLYLEAGKRKKFWIMYIFFAILYFISIAASLLLVIPMITKFFLSIGFLGVDFYIDANTFIFFIMKILLAFAIIFEFPILMILLISMGLIRASSLKKYRRQVFVTSFIAGAILTPPDVASQIVAALLIYSFFEIAIYTSRFFNNS